jgi:hypothetical protein
LFALEAVAELPIHLVAVEQQDRVEPVAVEMPGL